MVVADASVVIALAKIGRLGLLRAVFGRVIMSPVVKQEVVDRGLDLSKPEVSYIQEALSAGWLSVIKPTAAQQALKDRLAETTGLDAGELESIAIAKLRKVPVLADDKEARTTARAMGITVIGSAGILLEAFMIGEMGLDELGRAVRDLAGVLWLSPDVVASILTRAYEVDK